MSVFGELASKIFGHGKSAAPAPAAAPSAPAASAPAASAPAASAPAASAPVMAAPNAERAEDILEQLAAQNPQKLDWRNSIVDLMKLVHMDSSLAKRQELAKELGYTGDMNDSASMNVWLHKKVMENLAQDNGGVAANLLPS
jgi:3-oxoacyl-ACP reductase-like protein